MPNYTTSLTYIVYSWLIAMSYSDMWNIGVKCGAAITFILASFHMVVKIIGQLRDNEIKKIQLERAE